MSETAALARERTARMRAAIALKEHDRVPILGNLGYWPVKHYGKYTMQDALYNFDCLAESYEYVLEKWNEWDAITTYLSAQAPVWDALGSTRFIVPGRQISPYSDYQYPDQSVMSADEYDQLIADPRRFRAEVILPRVCKRIKRDDLYGTIKAVAKVFVYNQQMQAKIAAYWRKWQENYAVVPLYRGIFAVPVDVIADNLRGFNEGLLDVKLRPGKVIAASEALIDDMIDSVLNMMPAGQDFPVIYNPQHVSAFISPKDYDKVYWPFYKRMVDAFTAHGNTVWTIFEGAQDQHLERLQELPHGKCVAQFESTDLESAKRYLGGKICIAGGMPNSILAKGSVQDVEEQVAKVMKLFADEPGFIMATNGAINSAKPENIVAWLKATSKYGNLGGRLEISEPDVKPEGQVPADRKRKHITTWEEVREEFGEIKGDEELIKQYWEKLEMDVLGLVNSIIQA